MLRYTLILPEGDAAFAARTLQAAIDDVGVVLMLVLGTSAKAERVVHMADALCEGTGEAGFRLRRVVWVRDPAAAEVRAILDSILGTGKMPLVAVLNFQDTVKATLAPSARIDAVRLEIAFLKGHRA